MAAVKSARRRAREGALQALYAWQVGGAPAGDLVALMGEFEGHERADRALAEQLVRGVIERAGELQPLVAAAIDRPFEKLSPVERAILYIGAFELAALPATPFKVVINEAIELGKSFGAEGGHKFVNGVLEKLAARLRPAEVASARQATA